MNTLKKKFKKTTIIVIIALFSVIIYGCDGSGGNTPKFYLGYDGVIFDFLKNNPKEVYENETFYLAFLVKNLGPYEITQESPAKLSFSYDTKYIRLAKYNAEMDYENIILESRNPTNPLGGQEYLEFEFNSKKFDTTRDVIETGIQFNLCYPYNTILSTEVCIDGQKHLVETNKNPVCTPKDYSGGSGQGGPVVISRIVPKITSSATNIRPEFEIYIENRGKGFVLNNNGNDYFCDFEKINKDSIDNFNKISIKAKLYEEELECVPKELKLINNENQVRCFVKSENIKNYIKGQTSFITILTVELNYGYLLTERKEIEIKRLDDFEIKDFVSKEQIKTLELTDKCGVYEISNSNGECISLCEFCSKNPTDSKCKITSQQNILIDETFECKCSRTQCTQKNKKGECVFGLCPGSNYCCK